MVEPGALRVRPDPLLASLGGAVGVLLLASVLELVPSFGLPAVGYAELLGGVLVAGREAAFWLGWTLLFVVGWLVWPVAMARLWPALPGDDLRLPGAILKGALVGAALWALAGVLLPGLGALGRVEGVEGPGAFALGAGPAGAALFLAAHVGYGVAAAVVAGMGRGISPMESLGVDGYRPAGGPRARPETGVPAR